LTNSERAFVWLSALTVCAVMVVIVLGALVRITDADLACGGHYPLCNGRLIPRMGNHLGWVDWGHRLSTALTGLLVLLTIVSARRFAEGHPMMMRRVYVIVGLLALQVAVGAGTMLLDRPDTLPVLHLGLAIIMLSLLVSALVSFVYRPPLKLRRDADTFPAAVHGATLMTFLVLMTGAMIVGGGVEQHCTSFPFCSGNLSDGDLIHMVHRGAVLVLGLLFLTLMWRAHTERAADAGTVYGIRTLLMLYFAQVTLGALIVIVGSGNLVKMLHVTLAVLMWTTAAALSTIVTQQQTLETLDYPTLETEWETPSSAITSN
jgi:cytochrome c oxidase assembly protein subunit 15